MVRRHAARDEATIDATHTNHHNIHVRGYKKEGTITTPFDMTVLNDLDRSTGKAGPNILLSTASISIFGYEHNIAEVPSIVLWNAVSKEFST